MLNSKGQTGEQMLNFGYEMSKCFETGQQLPTMVEILPNDDRRVQQFKKLILRMTEFHETDRPKMIEVKHELTTIIQRTSIKQLQALYMS